LLKMAMLSSTFAFRSMPRTAASRVSFIPRNSLPYRWTRSLRLPSTALASGTPPPLSSAPASAPTLSKPPSVLGEDGQLPPQYNFAAVEEDMYTWWEAQGYFKPAPPSSPGKASYTVPMPPPNVTGKLHMGHAMFVALQDILARFHRMRGRPTLYLPGTDHAGIATQMLVEREVVSEGLTREGLGREAFLERAWRYKEKNAGSIVQQMRRLGASADWSRERFTLEPDMTEAVTEAFVRFHEDGLLYRGTRLVNWSPQLQTAVSDLEVEFSEETGKMYYFKYALADGSGDFLPVATTRPETILGDTAVCVHPEDPRFKHLVGKFVVLPVDTSEGRRQIPVIADSYVDMDFGTGCLKITPAHDPNDYELGIKFNLPMPNIMNKDGTINECGGAKYAGLDRYKARDAMWLDMEKEGATIKVEPHEQRVPRSQRGGEVIEPMLSTQWFLKMQGMADSALEVVANGQVQIKPQRFEKEWSYWLENIRDWCVSRQLWWGHRIPVWYLASSDFTSDPACPYFVGRDETSARAAAVEAGYPADVQLVQDNDVLDTWFSSGLWPFATLGWPKDDGAVKDAGRSFQGSAEEWNQLSDFNRFYPTTVLETGYDILFFWVARMVMMGMHFTGKPPFEVIYLHGLVRDASGAKMSKTKGNVIDPLVTIGQFGADALRYSLVTGVTPGQDVPLSMDKVEANRNFANKLWNAGRYLVGNLAGLDPEQKASLARSGPLTATELAALPVPERYIVSRCHELVEKVTAGLEAYEMSEVGFLIYQFLWDEYADWYIECSKTRMGDADSKASFEARQVLVYVFDTCLRLLHPFMPYVTEALWQELPTHPSHGESLMVAPWPLMTESTSSLPTDPAAVAQFQSLQALVKGVRNARAEYQVDPAKKVGAVVVTSDPALRATLEAEQATVSLLGRINPLLLTFADKAPDGKSVHLVVTELLEVYLPLAELVDADKEKKRLGKQRDKLAKDVLGLEKRMESSNFVAKASPETVASTKQQLKEKQDQLSTVLRSLQDL